MRTATAITLVTTMGLAASPALSQDAVNRTDSGTVAAPGANSAASNVAPTRNRDVLSLPDWHPDVSGANVQSVEDLIDNDVLGANGEDIGDVENVMFDASGKAVSIIAEVGGIWDIGDTHVNIPWSDLEFTADGVRIPVTEDTVGEYSLFDDDVLTASTAQSEVTEVDGGWFSDVDTGPRVWRATELIDDYARYQGGSSWTNYGYVDDVLIQDGQISAVVVRPDNSFGRGNGLYSYPYYGYDYGWSPGLANYDLPYDQATIEARQPMEGVADATAGSVAN